MPISPHKDESQSIGRHIDALVFLLKRDEKVARAQTLRLIRKYSEDEPRDELGRWTDGGGGGDGGDHARDVADPRSDSDLGKTVRLYRAGGSSGRFGDGTFYSYQAKGATPYGEAEPYAVKIPKDTFNAAGKDFAKYERFLNETNHPARRGNNGLPFWTVEPDLKKWLLDNGIEFSAIKFDENTGVPSIAIYGEHEAQKISDKPSESPKPDALDYSSLGKMPTHIEGVPITKKPLGGGMLAIGGSSGIAVSTSKRAREAWKDMAAYQQKAFDSGWMSSPHPNHTIWHELAHVKTKNESSVDHDSFLSNLRGGSSPHFKKMAEKVSKYAGVNGHEMLAEVFAATRAGRKLDADVMDYYDKVLKGPKP